MYDKYSLYEIYSKTRMNHEIPEIFEHRFARKPKEWTIQELHALMLNAADRSDRRNGEFSRYVHKILDTFEPDRDGNVKVYFYDKKWQGEAYQEDSLRMYRISRYKVDSWSFSTDWVEFKGNTKEEKRESMLEFLLQEDFDKRLEMGTEMRRLEDYRSKLHTVPKRELSKKVSEILEEQDRKSGEDNFLKKVSICGRTYYFFCERGYKYEMGPEDLGTDLVIE